jgi:hypothetical protein
MKKLTFLITVLGIIGIMLFPQAGNAELKGLSDTEMRGVTGQAGISLTAEDHLDLNIELDTLAYGDDDGVNGKGGYLSLNDMRVIGGIDFISPVSVEITTEMDPFQNKMLTGLNVSMDGVKVAIDEFSIGSITVGPNPGEGKSFGSISMSGYRAEISGKIRITTH